MWSVRLNPQWAAGMEPVAPGQIDPAWTSSDNRSLSYIPAQPTSSGSCKFSEPRYEQTSFSRLPVTGSKWPLRESPLRNGFNQSLLADCLNQWRPLGLAVQGKHKYQTTASSPAFCQRRKYTQPSSFVRSRPRPALPLPALAKAAKSYHFSQSNPLQNSIFLVCRRRLSTSIN